MFFLVEPSIGVALPILAGRTQLCGRFTGTPDDGMIVDIAVRSVRKCRNEVFDEDSSDSGDVSFRRFLEKNGGADDKDVAQYIEQNDGVLRELVERRGSDDDYRKLREAVYLLRRRLGEGDARRMSSGTMAMAVARAIAMVATTFGKSSNKMGPVSSRIPVCIAIAVRNTISNHTVRIPNAARYTNNATALAILPRKSAST